MLATVVQSRAAAHLTVLAEPARPTSPAAFGALSQRALDLAVQDAFWLTLGAFLLAFLIIFFIHVPRPVPQEPARAAEPAAPQEGEANREHSDEKARLSR